MRRLCGLASQVGACGCRHRQGHAQVCFCCGMALCERRGVTLGDNGQRAESAVARQRCPPPCPLSLPG